jgi:hypothetical protein
MALAVLAAGALMAGCTRIAAYEPLTDLIQAREEAQLVLVGDVVRAQEIAHYSRAEVRTQNLGVLGHECVADVEVLLNVQKVNKGVFTEARQVTFRFYAPCFQPEPGVRLDTKLPTFVAGDHVTAYLQNRDGKWWLIAHQIETATTAAPLSDRERFHWRIGNYEETLSNP